MPRFSASRPILTAAAAILMLSVLGRAHAQSATGYEVALFGEATGHYGEPLRLGGIAYHVRGLATLSPLGGAHVEARLTRTRRNGRGRETVQQAQVTATANGHFVLELAVPEEPLPGARLELAIGSNPRDSRTFEYDLALASPLGFDLLTDRNRYQPGETVHVWARLTRTQRGDVEPNREVRVRLIDPQGRPLAERVLTTRRSGAVSTDIPVPSSAIDGPYRVEVALEDPLVAVHQSRSITVGRRTVERLLVEVELDQDLVAPAGRLTGHVEVTAPSGSPIAGAQVELQIESSHAQTLVTNRDGRVDFAITAPGFLSGDMASQTLNVRVTHAAYGTLHAGASFLLSRVRWRVEASAQNRALVPNVDSTVFVLVTDPLGEPAPAGTAIEVSGDAVAGGRVQRTVSEHGLAVVPVRATPGSAAPSNDCANQVSIALDVSITDGRPFEASVCVPVAPEALVAIRVAQPLLTTGAPAEFTVVRSSTAANARILVEAIRDGRTVAWQTLESSEARGSISLPQQASGLLFLRARPLAESDITPPINAEGMVTAGTGSLDAIVVRPADAFSLTIEPTRSVYNVRETAGVRFDTVPPIEHAFATLVVRDLAAHGGEQPWSLTWMQGRLSDPIMQAADSDSADESMIRAALAAIVAPDIEAKGVAGLVPSPWEFESHRFSNSHSRGQLRDPIVMRDELLRRGMGRIMMVLEQQVATLGPNRDASREGIVIDRGGRTNWHPAAIANLVEQRRLSPNWGKTLGDGQLTVAMLEAADPSFTFDRVARRVARLRLMRLLAALAAFANPDDENAARASAGEPPSRWLARLVQLRMVESEALIDPWGQPFSFRSIAGTPRIVVSERALDYELTSAGPDGRFGTNDDVRDPFARVVPEGTPYAVASGEDELMRALSAVAIGTQVLARMHQAYHSLSLAAREEQREGIVTSTTSEADEVADRLVGLAQPGYRTGGAAPMPREEAEADDGEGFSDRMRDAPATQAQAARMPPPPSVTGALLSVAGELIREDFPATLFFAGEIELRETGQVVEFPVADALTTYKVEAIAWTPRGWTTSASTNLRVDRDAVVDAPIPPFATVGDTLRIPIRVSNRTDEPLRARVELSIENLHANASEVYDIEIAPRDASEVIVPIEVRAPGEGHAVVRVVRADDLAPLDAARRPLTVVRDTRLVRQTLERLVRSGQSITYEVPDDASPRGPGEIRIAPGVRLFGDVTDWSEPLLAAWALALTGERVPESLREIPRRILQVDNPRRENIGGSPGQVAMALGASWNDEAIADSILERALRRIGRVLGAEETREPHAEAEAVLFSLGPVVRSTARPSLRNEVDQLATSLRSLVGDRSAQTTDDPFQWSRAAMALGLTRRGAADRRGNELLRRLERFVVRIGEEAFVELPHSPGDLEQNLASTAQIALAQVALGHSESAMPFLRFMVRFAGSADAWPDEVRLLAAATAGLLSGPVTLDEPVRVSIDGQTETAELQHGILRVTHDQLGHPGDHRIVVDLPEGAVALAWIDLRFGRPWTASPRLPLPLALHLEGELGARDTRAGLVLSVRNRGARLLTEPVIEVDLPSGAEIDEPSRQALLENTGSQVTIEERTLRISLPSLLPGGRVQLPLPIRWSIGGELRGLGVTAFDNADTRSQGVRPAAILPSRTIHLGDRGEEPSLPDFEEERPPEIPPIPIPIPIPERLGPVS